MLGRLEVPGTPPPSEPSRPPTTSSPRMDESWRDSGSSNAMLLATARPQP